LPSNRSKWGSTPSTTSSTARKPFKIRPSRKWAIIAAGMATHSPAKVVINAT
jgi:hypothetical protein